MNRSIQVSALLLTAGVQASLAWGSCPKVASQETFEVERYGGLWYEIVRDKYMPFEFFANCVNAIYTPRSDGTVDVLNRAVLPFYGWYGLTGKGVESNEGGANLVVRLATNPETFTVPTPDEYANYRIISTDYDSYSIFYSCTDKWGGWVHEDYFYILAREPEISREAMVDILSIVYEKIPEYDFWANYIMPTQGDECDYAAAPLYEPIQ